VTDVLLLRDTTGLGLVAVLVLVSRAAGRLSKWLCVLAEMADSWSISDEMTSGLAACVRM
jgi:hypothetical protein